MTFRKRWKAVAALALLLASTGLSACNTMQGAGEDISAAGRGLSGSARETERKF